MLGLLSYGVNLKRPWQLFRRFPARIAWVRTVCEGARAWLDPWARHGYGRCGEDIVLTHYLDFSKPDFYVDVGCNHPVKGSLTVNLYSRGWHGLVVDGNPEMIRQFRRCRPKDICISAVVSNEERPVTFAVAKEPTLSTLSAEFEATRLGPEGVERRIETHSVRLDNLFRMHAVPRVFEFLSIDVERHDWEVLTSFDLEEYRPRVVAIEMHGFRPGKTANDKIYSHLTAHGYALRSYVVDTAIFVDERER